MTKIDIENDDDVKKPGQERRLLLRGVYFSKNSSARTLKMALHKNPVMHYTRVVIFQHGSQKKGRLFKGPFAVLLLLQTGSFL